MNNGRSSGRDEIIGKAFMWSSVLFLLLGAVVAIIVISVRDAKEPIAVNQQQLPSSISGPNLTDRIEHLPLPFTKVNSDWNIDFYHQFRLHQFHLILLENECYLWIIDFY